MNDKQMLICSDLDRTIIPNGSQEESPQARPALRKLAQRPEVTLVYVSGRHLALLQRAVEKYELPMPDYAIGDVGTTIYDVDENGWRPWERWQEEIGQDWHGITHDDLAAMFTDIETIRLQEPEKQNPYKLSYYVDDLSRKDKVLPKFEQRLKENNVKSNLIWSVDEAKELGLIDILPERATKLHAIRFLMEDKNFEESRTVFCGDSGNDMAPLTSGLQAVLVKNAMDDVREEAVETVRSKGFPEKLYLAQGGFLGMNGNYSAGVLEGISHFLPETKQWMEND